MEPLRICRHELSIEARRSLLPRFMTSIKLWYRGRQVIILHAAAINHVQHTEHHELVEKVLRSYGNSSIIWNGHVLM